ncbi:hypothetical protein BMS3Bbin02_02352 [bacterium BMS3Bbin02]|nr:hypothetical protein BMS3Bbin02_02352 [bacterium BMS3Bbin02]
MCHQPIALDHRASRSIHGEGQGPIAVPGRPARLACGDDLDTDGHRRVGDEQHPRALLIHQVDSTHKPVLVNNRLADDDPVGAALIDDSYMIKARGALGKDCGCHRGEVAGNIDVEHRLKFEDPRLHRSGILDAALGVTKIGA